MAATRGFRSARGLGWVVSALLCAHVVVAMLAVARFLSEVDLVQRVEHGGVTATEIELLDHRLRQVSTAAAVLFLTTAVAWLLWEYLSYRNLESFRVFGTDTSPRGSVGWWFVPFANFVKPFRAVRDLWKGSDPDLLRSWTVVPTWPVIGWWWATFLGMRFVFRIAATIRHGSTTAEGVVAGDRLAIAGELVLAAAAVLAILIVRSVGDRQAGRAAVGAAPPRPDR